MALFLQFYSGCVNTCNLFDSVSVLHVENQLISKGIVCLDDLSGPALYF